MQTIRIEKKTAEYEAVKALWDLAKLRRKADKNRSNVSESMHYIHYNVSTKCLEATDGRAALVYHHEIAGLDHEVFFELCDNVLVEAGTGLYFPAVPRVIPELGHVNMKGETCENFLYVPNMGFDGNFPADYLLCSALGHFRVVIDGKYAALVKDLLNRFDYIASFRKDGEIAKTAPVYFHSAELEYVVMPLNKYFVDAEITSVNREEALKKTA